MKRYGLHAAVLGLIILTMACSSHPSDAVLLSTFNDRRAQFDRLLEISRRDAHLQRIAHDWCADQRGNRYFGPTAGVLPVESWGEYRTLFYDLRIDDGIEVKDGTLYLLVSNVGHGPSRSTKGYAYSRRGSNLPTCPSLDPAGMAESGVCFQPLEAGWYLFARR